MLIDRDAPEDVFARVPELADQTDPVLIQLDHLLDDDDWYGQVHDDLARRSPLTLAHGRHSTPAEVIVRLLVVQHVYAWSYQETVDRVGDSLVVRWFCRVYFRRVPVATTVLRWAATIQPATLQALNDRVALLAKQASTGDGRAQTAAGQYLCTDRDPSPNRQWAARRRRARAHAAHPPGQTAGCVRSVSSACTTPSAPGCAQSGGPYSRYIAGVAGVAGIAGHCRRPRKPRASARCTKPW